MISGEKRVLLQKNSEECFPQPPPAPRENTTYSMWQAMNCIPDNLPLWQQSQHYSVQFAAETYNFCAAFTMKPFNFCTYKICCNSDLEKSCNDNLGLFSNIGACLISLPKLPCCLLAGVSAFTAGFVGLIADGVTYCAPKQQSMDAPSASEYTIINNSEDGQYNAKAFPQEILLENHIKHLLEEKSLEAAMNFYYKNQILMNTHPRFYPYKVFFICLAISCPDEAVTLSERKRFILDLADQYIINGYNSSEGWIPAPLLEAIRSTYRYSSELLEFVCDLGAHVSKTVGRWSPNYDNLLALAYADFFDNPSDMLFYKLLVLRKYEIDRPIGLQIFINANAEFKKLDEHLKALDEKENNPTLLRGKLNEVLTFIDLPKDIAAIIGQYSALYSPVEFKENYRTIIEAKSISLSNADHSEATSESKSEKIDLGFNGKLFKHYPLPRYEKLPDAELDKSADNERDYGGLWY